MNALLRPGPTGAPLGRVHLDTIVTGSDVGGRPPSEVWGHFGGSDTPNSPETVGIQAVGWAEP